MAKENSEQWSTPVATVLSTKETMNGGLLPGDGPGTTIDSGSAS